MPRRPRIPSSATFHGAIQRIDPAADPATYFKAGDTPPQSFAAAVEHHLTAQADQEAVPPAALSLEKRLKSYPSPQQELDCHGLTAAETERRLHWFLDRARYQALRTVRIITGRGLHSPNGPVLPEVVETELRLLQKNGQITGFRWEKKEREQSGAVIVYL